MPARSTPPISFEPIKLLKVDIDQGWNGTSVIMEFIDNNGTRLTTPRMPYPDNFDPMRIENADRGGDEIRIKNSNGEILMSVYADSIDIENPIETLTDSHGHLCIEAEEGEENTPLRTFSLDQAHPSGVGFTQAFEQANRAQQQLDSAVQTHLNEQYEREHPPIGASAWFRQQQEQTGLPSAQAEECEMPRINFDYDMKCTCCEGKIHYPDKMVSLLGVRGAIKYFEFCKKTGSEPQMFCCSCFAIMKNNSNIISAINKMHIKIKDMMDLTDREETVTKREKELDEQLKKIKK